MLKYVSKIHDNLHFSWHWYFGYVTWCKPLKFFPRELLIFKMEGVWVYLTHMGARRIKRDIKYESTVKTLSMKAT